MKRYFFTAKTSSLLGETLTQHIKLDSRTILKMIQFGAVKVRPSGKKNWGRIRDPNFELKSNDELQAFYEPHVLNSDPFVGIKIIEETKNYAICVKPAGIMSQGTDAGDHRSVLYAFEMLGKTPYLVHRLDRETEGLMIVAYNSLAAARLSELFNFNKINKTYKAIVVGDLSILPTEGMLDQALDGKESITYYKVLGQVTIDQWLIELKPKTGRLHQIRRHLEMLGYPILGDPKYGKGNKNKEGMRLAAVKLELIDPWTQKIHLSEYFPEFIKTLS